MKRWSLSFALTTMLLVIAYYWLDRPIALFVHEHFRSQVFDVVTRYPDPLWVVAFGTLVIAGARILIFPKPRSKPDDIPVCAAISLIVAHAVVEELKPLFGRTWPETWIQNNPSFVRDGVYGFHLLHSGPANAAFPSGHMAASCAALIVLWLSYPRFKVAYIAAGLAAGIGLVAGNYHFLGDVIAGGFFGYPDRCNGLRFLGSRSRVARPMVERKHLIAA